MARNKYSEVEEKIMNDVSKNLKAILTKKGIFQIELCEKTGIARSTISDYVNGKTLIPAGNLEIIASALGVHKSDIDSSLKQFNDSSDTTNIPVLDKFISNASLDKNIIGSEQMNISSTKKEDYFFIQVQDDAMIGEGILPGDLALIQKTNTYENGNIVLAVEGENNIIRKVFKSEGNYILQAANSAYDPIIVNKEVMELVGVVKQTVRKY